MDGGDATTPSHSTMTRRLKPNHVDSQTVIVLPHHVCIISTPWQSNGPEKKTNEADVFRRPSRSLITGRHSDRCQWTGPRVDDVPECNLGSCGGGGCAAGEMRRYDGLLVLVFVLCVLCCLARGHFRIHYNIIEPLISKDKTALAPSHRQTSQNLTKLSQTTSDITAKQDQGDRLPKSHAVIPCPIAPTCMLCIVAALLLLVELFWA